MGQEPLAKAWIQADALSGILAAFVSCPGEAPCGVLLGSVEGTAARVRQAPQVPNTHPTPDRAFRIAAQDLLVVVRAARKEGLGVIGFWHGDPRGPAEFGEASEEGLDQAEALGASARLMVVAGHGTGRARVVRAFARGRYGQREIPLRT